MTTLARVPDPVGTRARRLGGPIGAAAAIGVATLALRLHDPHQQGSWGLCPFKAITGWDCPACGGLRAVNDLGHGQIVEAAHSNLVFVASVPLVLGLWLLWLRRGRTGEDSRLLPAAAVRPVVTLAAVALVLFTIYRNTPWGAAWHVA
jgi:hypothetical protein